MIKQYEFSKGTLAIVPNDENTSLVYEDNERYVVENNPFHIMEDSCRYFGSSYEGRKVGAKTILGAEYKVPIIIEDSSNLIVFPTTSPTSDDCYWLCLNRIKNIEKVDLYSTRIIFDNNREIIVPCSFRSIENQLSRASRLEFILNKRKLNK